MSVHKREGHWHFTKTINGVRYRGALKTARTKSQAEEAERVILTNIHNGTYRKDSNAERTLREFVEKAFTPWAKASKKSWRNDVSRLKPIVLFFGKYRLKEISPFLVESFKTKRRRTPVVYTKQIAPGVYEQRQKPRSSASVNRELQLLSRIFSLADVQNPCSKVDLLKGERKRKRYLLPEERERLIQALEAPGREWLTRIVLVDLYTGLRRNELLGLRPEHIDFARNIICVRGARSAIDLGTKTDEDREVYMNSTVRGILADQVAEAQANGWAYAFTNPRTGTRYKDIKNGFKCILRAAGIDNFWFHDLRHSFATRAGCDPSVAIPALAETLGHKNWQTTMRYAHATEEAKRRVVEAQEKVS